MNAYLDTSVLLRHVFQQTPSLREWDELIVGVTSELARVECLRALDRLRLGRRTNDESRAAARERIDTLFRRIDVLPLESRILARASEPLPTLLATLDAIHLATALFYRAAQPDDESPIYFATFDRVLSTCARATGFRVLGV